jgi:hypothetical protein
MNRRNRLDFGIRLIVVALAVMPINASAHTHGEESHDYPALHSLHEMHVASGSYNRARRSIEAAGGWSALRQRGDLQAELAAFLKPGEEEVHQSEAIAIAARLRLSEAVEPLRAFANHPQRPTGLRLQAVHAVARIEPGSDFAQEWIGAVVEEKAFLTWNSAEQEILLSLLPLLPIDDTVRLAQDITAQTDDAISNLQQQGPDAVSAIGMLGHVRSTAQRHILEAKLARSLDTAVEARLVPVLTDAFLEDFADEVRRERILQTAIRRDVAGQVIANARERLASGAQTPALLLLIDELGGDLSDLELRRLEQAFPPPPACG